MINFTRSAAMELAPHGIRVNGFTPTATMPEDPELAERFQRGHRRRPGRPAWTSPASCRGPPARPRDYVGALVFLASDESAMVTGTEHHRRRRGAGQVLAPGPRSRAARAEQDPMTSPYVIDDREKGRFRVNRRVMVDPDVLELERGGSSTAAGSTSATTPRWPSPMTSGPARWVGGPLIFTRNADGHVQVFINSCPHRGALLCREKAGHGRFLRCFYHAWTFDTSGKLVALPDEEAYGPCFDREELGLAAPPRVESYRGFWWVNYDPDMVDLATYLGDAAPILDLFVDQGLDDGLEILGGTHEYSMRANWKLLVENSFDGYHAMPTHQRYMEMVQASGVDLSNRFAPAPDGSPRSWARELGGGHGMVGGTAGLGRDLHGRAAEIDAQRRARYRSCSAQPRPGR